MTIRKGTNGQTMIIQNTRQKTKDQANKETTKTSKEERN